MDKIYRKIYNLKCINHHKMNLTSLVNGDFELFRVISRDAEGHPLTLELEKITVRGRLMESGSTVKRTIF